MHVLILFCKNLRLLLLVQLQEAKTHLIINFSLQVVAMPVLVLAATL